MVCNKNSVVRAIHFRPFGNSYWSAFRVHRIDNFTGGSASISQSFSYYIKTLYVPFITGRYYSFTYGTSTNYDFSYLYITPSNRYEEDDEAIVFKHDYINNRELFEVKTIELQGASDPQTNIQKTDGLSISDCSLGDFYHDNDEREFGVCVSPKNWSEYEYIRA